MYCIGGKKQVTLREGEVLGNHSRASERFGTIRGCVWWVKLNLCETDIQSDPHYYSSPDGNAARLRNSISWLDNKVISPVSKVVRLLTVQSSWYTVELQAAFLRDRTILETISGINLDQVQDLVFLRG